MNRHPDNEAFERIAQPMPRIPIPISSPSPPHPASWYVSSESGSVLDVSTAGFKPEHPPYTSTVYDYARRDRDDHCYGWEVSIPSRGYESHALGYPLGLPLSPSQYANARGRMLDEPFPRFRGYGTIYTDDARMKLGDGIRRQCFNCRATETTTWRRSMLSTGKLLCNKCGLFERTHAVPRPKSFPRRRRSRPASVHPSVDPPALGSEEHYDYSDSPPNMIMPLTSPYPNAFGTVDGAAASQDMSWMAHDRPHVSSTFSHNSPYHSDTDSSRLYRADFQSLSTVPTTAVRPPSPSWELLSHHVN